jgi:hypothetical protein
MARKKILLIGGSLNQTTMMHKIAKHLDDYDCYFTPCFGEGFIKLLSENRLLDFTILGGKFREDTENYLRENCLPVDLNGATHDYALALICTDLIVPKSIRDKKTVLVQEGMTDPENFMYHLVKWAKLPRYLASTAAAGLSDAYDKFCVASEGYRELFVSKGAKPEKIVVTGIPNFDNAQLHFDNDFPHKNFVLVATSDARETFKYDNRKKFIQEAVHIANGRQMIFKLHPNEKVERAKREISEHAPGALIFADGNINDMIANCDVLITQYSSVSYIGLALGKEVHSYFNLNLLKKLMPIQNGGTSAKNIAAVCREYLQ